MKSKKWKIVPYGSRKSTFYTNIEPNKKMERRKANGEIRTEIDRINMNPPFPPVDDLWDQIEEELR